MVGATTLPVRQRSSIDQFTSHASSGYRLSVITLPTAGDHQMRVFAKVITIRDLGPPAKVGDRRVADYWSAAPPNVSCSGGRPARSGRHGQFRDSITCEVS